MIGRRLLVLLAVLLGLTALAAGIAPRQAATPPAAEAPRASTAAPVERPLHRTIDADAPGRRRIVVDRGRLVRLTVKGDVVDSVQLDDLDVQPIDPSSPALFEWLADAPGRYPITLLDAGRRLGVLEVKG